MVPKLGFRVLGIDGLVRGVYLLDYLAAFVARSVSQVVIVLRFEFHSSAEFITILVFVVTAFEISISLSHCKAVPRQGLSLMGVWVVGTQFLDGRWKVLNEQEAWNRFRHICVKVQGMKLNSA